MAAFTIGSVTVTGSHVTIDCDNVHQEFDTTEFFTV